MTLRAACLWLGLLAAPATAEITGARYGGPTDVYGHGAVPGGDYSGLVVDVRPGRSFLIGLRDRVFEDTAPRLADLDGDGAPEVVTVVSTFDGGAGIVIWGMRDGSVAQVGQGVPIGQRNRWLAIAGIGDIDGDGRMEIAYVDRPHLARVLRVVEVGPGFALREEASAAGHTNHRFGDARIEGGIADCGLGPEVLTADPGWTRVQGTRLVSGRFTTRDLGPYRGALRCP